MSDRFCFQTDMDGHWYIVPEDQLSHFSELMEELEEDDWTEEWQDKWNNAGFGDMMIGGHPSAYSFVDPRTID